MTNLEFLLDQKARCEAWLAAPAEKLPGTLTHKKVNALLERTEDELLDYLRYAPASNRWIHAD